MLFSLFIIYLEKKSGIKYDLRVFFCPSVSSPNTSNFYYAKYANRMNVCTLPAIIQSVTIEHIIS